MDAVIAGWGHTPFGKFDDLGLEDLILLAAREALDHAGIDPALIGGAWLGHFNSGLVADGFASSMVLASDPALRFKPAIRCENACASGAAALYSALDAVNSGRVRAALVVGAEKMTGLDTAGVGRALSGATYQREEAGVTFPQVFSRFAKAYAETFGDPTRAMAEVAVKNHRNALRNPLAHMRKELELDFCLARSERNPVIADPLKVSDCSLISDGAAALVILHRDLLPECRRAVGFRTVTQVSDLLPISAKRLSQLDGPQLAFERAYAEAKVSLSDIGIAEVHDCFTIAEVMIMEAMGFARPGQAGKLLEEGQTRPDGKLPINVSGGLKAKGHPVGATGVSMHVMIARQLTGAADDMQLPSHPKLGMCFNMGGGAVTSCVSILEPLKI